MCRLLLLSSVRKCRVVPTPCATRMQDDICAKIEDQGGLRLFLTFLQASVSRHDAPSARACVGLLGQVGHRLCACQKQHYRYYGTSYVITLYCIISSSCRLVPTKGGEMFCLRKYSHLSYSYLLSSSFLISDSALWCSHVSMRTTKLTQGASLCKLAGNDANKDEIVRSGGVDLILSAATVLMTEPSVVQEVRHSRRRFRSHAFVKS